MQVNGNLVSPAHVLANAEVVEIITYNVSIVQLILCVCFFYRFDVIGKSLRFENINLLCNGDIRKILCLLNCQIYDLSVCYQMFCMFTQMFFVLLEYLSISS